MVNKSGEEVKRESLHAESERHAIYVIIDAIFGLSLGLGAFSLTELPILSSLDLYVAVGFFGFSYLVIFFSWMIIRRYFVGHTVYGAINSLLFVTGFFVAIMPIPIRIILMQFLEPTSMGVLEGAFLLYPLCLCFITITVGLFSFVFFRQSGKTAPKEDLIHLLSEGVGFFVIGLVFLVSAFIPYKYSMTDALSSISLPKRLANLPLKIGAWLFGGIFLVIPVVIITRHIISRRKNKNT
jgi:hypothetical protein